MQRLNLLTGAAIAVVLGTAGAQAADMPVYYEAPQEFGGWYLRGDVGASHQFVKDIDNLYYDQAVSYDIHDKEFDASWFIGLGVGYQFNEYFRADITGEYRGKSQFHGLDSVFDGTDTTINDIDTHKSEWTLLTNVYWDIGTWGIVTPFIGAGVGASYNKIHDLDDDNLSDPPDGGGYADEHGEWQFAWALHAGLAFAVAPNIAVEVAYRYLNLGDARSGDIIGNDGTNNDFNPLEFDNLQSHDVKVGMRYTFN